MVRHAVVATLLGVAALALHLAVARRFDALGVFGRRNVLFDADVSTRLRALTSGRHLGIKHPNMMPYFTPPVALLAKAIVCVHPASGPEPRLRRRLGTLVVPAASALKTGLVFIVLCELGFALPSAVVATLLEMMSFSTLLFGSIPESYGLTALAIAMAYACAVGAGGTPGWRRVGVWLAVGVFATGITLTNVVPVALLAWAAAWTARPRFVAAGIRAAGIAVVAFGLTGVSAFVLDRLLVPRKPPAVGEVAPDAPVADRVVGPIRHELEAFVASDPARKLGRFPTTVANAFAPSSRPDTLAPDERRRAGMIGLTLERSPNVFGRGDPFGLVLFLLLVAGAARSLALPATRPIATASVAICVFSWLLGVWGSETLLYSQHWHLAAVVLLAGVMRSGPYAALMTVVVGVLTLAIAAGNLALLRDMLLVIGAPPPL
jgi:hypothetical protein